MEKKQILFIKGGMTFKNRDDYLDYLRNRDISLDDKVSWNGEYLKRELEGFHIIKPRMPLQDDAKYDDWKICFERYLDLLDDGAILIGVSLGGIFLAKYLSENVLSKRIASVYLVCPPFDNTLGGGEDLVGGFELGDDLSMIMKNCSNVTLFFSKDDDCVPVSHVEKYREKLNSAKIVIYESKNGHFEIEEFPEIVGMIWDDFGE